MNHAPRPHIYRVERLSAFLVGIATLLSLLFWDVGITLGVVLGGALASLNFFALRKTVQSIIEGTNQRKQVIMVVLLMAKLAALAAVIYLVISYLPVNPLALLAGISVTVLSIFIEGFRAIFGGAAPQSE